ncbi:unnamed protein product, partial [Didymodactylos carnosus]
MNNLVQQKRWLFCLIYLDDIIIFSTSFKEHLQHLDESLSVLKQANFQLNPSKCSLIKQEMNYLGHKVNKFGIQPLDDNIRAILQLPQPQSVKQVHSFVQTANYYRKFIPNFSTLANPLYKFTKKNAQWSDKEWGDKEQQAYDQLKKALTTPPLLLHFPDPNYPLVLVLSTDASKIGMGGVLKQITPNGPQPIVYISKKLSSAQRKYSTIEQECLAIIHCVKQLKHYLDGREFTIETDHCPLCNLHVKQSSNARIDRWSMELSAYNIIQLKHKKGKCNCDADLMSRYPVEPADEYGDQVTRI